MLFVEFHPPYVPTAEEAENWFDGKTNSFTRIHWHVGDNVKDLQPDFWLQRIPFLNITVQATGSELTWVASMENLPFTFNSDRTVCRWFGDHAKFIFDQVLRHRN